MIQKKVDLRLDIRNPARSRIEYVQGDTNVYPLYISITDQGKAVDLTDATQVSLIFVTPSGAVIEGICEIVDKPKGEVKYILGSNEIAEVGTVLAELKIFAPEERLLTSTRFAYNVRGELLSDDVVQSQTEVRTLTGLINEVNQILIDLGGADGINAATLENSTKAEILAEASLDAADQVDGVQTQINTLGTTKANKTDIPTLAGTRLWASPEYTPVTNAQITSTHSLNIDANKCRCDVRLVCKVAEKGYSVGDPAINWFFLTDISGGSFPAPPIPSLSTNSVQINVGNHPNSIYVMNKLNGAREVATLANWRVVFRVWS